MSRTKTRTGLTSECLRDLPYSLDYSLVGLFHVLNAGVQEYAGHFVSFKHLQEVASLSFVIYFEQVRIVVRFITHGSPFLFRSCARSDHVLACPQNLNGFFGRKNNFWWAHLVFPKQ